LNDLFFLLILINGLGLRGRHFCHFLDFCIDPFFAVFNWKDTLYSSRDSREAEAPHSLPFLGQYSWPLKSVVLPFDATFKTLQGLIAENGPNGESVNPFLEYPATGGAYKYVLGIKGANNAVFQLRLPTT
jgi:hypothetical protein